MVTTNRKVQIKTKTPRFTEVAVLDICTPDYFKGYSYPVLTIPVSKGMYNHDLKEAIENEINQVYDYLVNDNENSFTEKEIELFTTFAKELLTREKELILPNYDFCECDECECEGPYIHLSLCKPVTQNGMTFLNE